MKTIYKYQIPVAYEMGIEVPGLIEWLHVAVQHEQPCIWALVDNEKPVQRHGLRVRWTGHPFDGREGAHLGSFMLDGGALVFHVFADKE